MKEQPGEEEEGSAIPEPGTHPTLQHGRTISLARGEGKKLVAEGVSSSPQQQQAAEPEVRSGMRRGKSFSVSVTAQVGVQPGCCAFEFGGWGKAESERVPRAVLLDREGTL